MTPTKRLVPLLAVTSAALFVLLFHFIDLRESWQRLPQAVGLGETLPDPKPAKSSDDTTKGQSRPTAQDVDQIAPKPAFRPGNTKPPGSNYTRTLVMPRMSDEDVGWIGQELPDIDTAIYVADDPSATLHPPKNKGHEVMIYLTYIIDHYDELPDVMIFMHAHRYAWHNDDLLDYDASQMIKRLSSERVSREGYMNMRCHWDPGCPDWMHPGTVDEDINKQEEVLLAKSWSELFPLDPIPDILAQPCCAQFALSRDRVQSIPLSRFIFYRDWLLRTPLSDYISGRIWEYLWQFVFTGQNVACPVQHACYCDGFGLCFGGPNEFNDWFELRYQLQISENELLDWHSKDEMIQSAKAEGRLDDAAHLEVPELGKDVVLREKIDGLMTELGKRKEAAFERGKDPRIRAEESGRPWQEGDGF
ncbi:MAG: hypothetical protein M1819_004889 [Sarea resinae]|nr:MAG: hypothetical protein M1819_004889 [Sarea resinae]